jgi:hypothetical protein
MKKSILFLFIVLIIGMAALPEVAMATASNVVFDGRNKPKKSNRKVTQKKAGKRSVAKAKPAKKLSRAEIARRAAEAERQRRAAEEARRAAIARAIAFENALRKTAADNISRDVTDGEDLAVRKVVVEAIGNNAATAVVMETQTGKIATIVNQDWAIRKSFAPCSTIKLPTTVAGLKENVIDEEDEASQEDLQNALARSKNGYFGAVGAKLVYGEFVNVVKKLGLGKPTGINAAGESSGKLSLVKKTALVYSHGYGIEITALQQAVMVSIIANHGKKVTPYIDRKSDKPSLTAPAVVTIDLPVANLDGAIPGMKGAAEYGTAHRGVDFTLGIAGKTGTCSATGTFTSVAPIDNPKYTVVVITRGNFGKGKYAAAIAGKIYLGLKNLGYLDPQPMVVATKPASTLILQ